MRDAQPPNRALLAVQNTNAAAKKKWADHKSKASVDMQYRKEDGRKQYRMNVGILAL